MEKVELLKLPTPLHRIEVDGRNSYYIKRDDMTDFALGGNKARKMEYFLRDALYKGCDCLVTYGSAHSNHCRVAAAAAAREGLKCTLILSGSESDLTLTGNDMMYFLCGAELVWTDVSDVSTTIDREIEKLKAGGFNPYFIPGGGHGNLGTHAYAEAYREISAQSEELGIGFDYIFLASGTGTTHAGLIAGKELSGGCEEIVGISIARREARGRAVISESLKCYIDEVDPERRSYDFSIIFEDSYVGKGYADVYPEIAEAIRFMLCRNSIVLDPVYTGKAFYGMCDYLKRENIEGKSILFIHTGGIPIFFSKGREVLGKLGLNVGLDC